MNKKILLVLCILWMISGIGFILGFILGFGMNHNWAIGLGVGLGAGFQNLYLPLIVYHHYANKESK